MSRSQNANKIAAMVAGFLDLSGATSVPSIAEWQVLANKARGLQILSALCIADILQVAGTSRSLSPQVLGGEAGKFQLVG